MDADVDSAWICTQAIVSTDSQSDDEQEKINNYGYIVLNDMIDNERYILKEGDNTIGRHPLNHIYIEHPSVSMNHAVIQCDSDGVVLLDKGSLNKTKLNKKTLRKDVAYFLEENALLMFGEVQADYFINEKSIEFKNDTKSMAPDNTSLHQVTQNDELSLSKLSNTVNIPKLFRTDIPNAISDCNVSLVIENKSTFKIEKEVNKTITGTECAMNTVNDIHTKLNSSSPCDEYLLEALSQVETKQNNINSNEIVHNLSNEATCIMNLTESVSEITREDTPSPVMDLKSSILTTNNVTKNQFQSPNKINTEAMREDTPSPVMDLKSSILTTTNVTKKQFQSPNKINTEAMREDTPSPVMDLKSSILSTNNIPKNLFQSPSKINKEQIREDTPSPIMDFGCCNDFENDIETNNHGIISAIQSPNEVDKFNNTQVLEIDNNIVELYTHTSNNDEAQDVESGEQSIIPIKNSLDISSKGNLSGPNDIHLSTNGNNSDKRKIIVNTFEADDDDVFRHFIEKECKSQQHDMAKLENQDIFNCPTQKVSIKKHIQPKVTSSIHDKETQNLIDHSKSLKNNARASTIIHDDLTQIPEMDDDFFNCPTQKLSTSKKLQPKVTSSIHDEETQELLEFSKPCKSNLIVSKSYIPPNQNPKIDDDFFNCPTQKLSTSKNIFPNTKVSLSIHEEETQRPPEFSQFNKTNIIASNNYSTNINKDLTEVPDMDDDFFNCPTQKLSTSKKLRPKVTSSIHDEETQELLEFSKPCKSNLIVSKSYIPPNQNPKIDDDFFNCPTQKLSTPKNIFPNTKVSLSIHEEETQRPPEFSQFNKTNIIASNNYSTNRHVDLTEVLEIDDDFFNCPSQKVSTAKKIPPKLSSSIHDEDTQKLFEFSKPCKSYSSSIHEENTQNPKIDDDFFNCPTQKLSTSKNIFPKPKVSPLIHEEETQRPVEFTQLNKTNTITSKTSSTNIHEDLTEILNADEDFFNCPTQKLLITKKINPKSKVSSSERNEDTQELFEFSKPCKSNSITSKIYFTNIHEENTQNPKIDDDFFSCPTQKLSTSKNILPNTKVSPSIHEEETQRPLEFSQFNKTNNIASNNYSTNIDKDLTEVPEMDDDFFNCQTQKVLITKTIKPNLTSSIHDEETQELLEFSKPCKSSSILSKCYSTSIYEENTQNPQLDDDFFNCPTQKLSTSKKINPKPKAPSSIHDQETQELLEFSKPCKRNSVLSKCYSTSIYEENTQNPKIDDDFFNCPTQKLSTSKKINPKPKAPSSIHDQETQELLEFSKPCKSNSVLSKCYSTSIYEENTQNPKIDYDFFNCPTQKLSTSKKINPKPKAPSSIHDQETQELLEFSKPCKSNSVLSKCYSTSIYEENTQNPKIDDDFFNCPTQKLSTSKKINPKPKAPSSIHDQETQELLEFSKPCKSNSVLSKCYSTSIYEENTQNPKIDDDFFNCPTQKLSTSKKINPKPKAPSSIHDQETQELLEFSKPCKSNSVLSKCYSTSIYEENPKIDDDFFNCPTQKLSTSKKINPKPKVPSSIHDQETQELSEFSQSDKINNIASNSYSTNRHVDLTEVPEIDDDFFNCPTQKLSITEKLNPKPTISSSIHEEETQRPPEFSQFDKTNNITSTSIHGDLKDVLKIDDEDFFNCPTQKVSCNSNSKFSMDCKKHKSIPIMINEAETKDSSIQSISKTSMPSNIKQNKGNIANSTPQKVLTAVLSKTISNCSININEDVTKNPEQFDETNSNKETVVPDNKDRCKVQKSKFVKSNIKSLSNVQLPVMCNDNSSNSLRTNKPKIRVREDLHNMSCSDGSSNNSTINLNKPNKNSIFNNINTTVSFNKNFDSPGCSKTTTIKKNDLNASASIKQECFIDDSNQSQVSISLKYNNHLKPMNEPIFSPLNIPDVSANSLLEDHSSPITIENNLNTLKCEPSTSSNDAFKWKSFWNKKREQGQDKGKSDKQKSIKITPEVKENKERYQTRAITRKRKQNGIVESNKKLCNRNNISEPLVENSSEIVVSFSYLKSRHLQEMKEFVEKTGGTVTDDITQCTVLVTDKIRCTMKILSAIAKGCPIVNVNWVKHSYTVKMFQDVDDFIIADKDAERKYMFQLKKSLAKAKTKRLLDGYNVLVTPSVKPSPQEMKVIITCAGGNFVLNWTTTQYTKELIVTCDKDRTRWKPVWDNDLAKIIDSDTLVMSIIRQQLTI